jgi:DinB superfamily
MMPATNVKIEDIRHTLQSSYYDLNRLIAGPLLQLDTKKLYQPPAPGEWTLMENLVHIIEFMPYWANEITKLLTTPGQKFGRSAQDEERIRAIKEHSSYTLAQVAAALPDSYARMDRVLGTLKDDDLDITGIHSIRGTQRLEWFIAEVLIKHLADHIQQMKEVLATL